MYDDLDLMVGPTLENGVKLVEACTQLGQPPSEWTSKTIAEPGLKILRMKSVHYADIVTPPEGVEFASLHARTGPIKVNGQACRVIKSKHPQAATYYRLSRHSKSSRCFRASAKCFHGSAVGGSPEAWSNEVTGQGLGRYYSRYPFRPISVDGLSGPETIGAIRVFQEKVTKIVDGRVDPHGPSWRALVVAHNAIVRSFIVIQSKKILDYLDENIRASDSKLPQHIASGIAAIRADIQALGTPVVRLRPQTSSDGVALGFTAPSPVIGVVIVDDVVILIIAIFALLFMFAIIIAKPALEELLRQLLILLNKIKEFIEEAVDAVKNAVKKNIKAFQQCKTLFDQIIALAAEILLDMEALKRIPHGDQLGRERAIRALAGKLQRFQALVEACFVCMGLPTPVIPVA